MHFNNIISGADLGGREVGSITCKQSAFIIMQTVCACDTANLFICTVNLQTKLHKIQSHKVTFSKFSWGGMPPDPPRGLMLRISQSVLRTLCSDFVLLHSRTLRIFSSLMI